jgi:hypothetical protein
MLDVGSGEASVAGAAQAAGADVLGEGGFDPGPYRVTPLPVLGLLVQPVAGLDFVEFAGGQERECAGPGG